MLFKFLPNVRANGNPGSIVSDRNSTVVEEHRPKAMQRLVIAGAVGGGGVSNPTDGSGTQCTGDGKLGGKLNVNINYSVPVGV